MSLAALAAVIILSSTGTAIPIKTCAQQSKCLKFQVYKRECTPCTGVGSCPVRVCMRFDTNDPLCDKDGATVSHACDNADAKGCVRAEEWKKDSNKGTSVDGDFIGPCPTNTSDTKCETIPDEFLMCQDGNPGDTLYFTVYVSDIGRETFVHSLVRVQV